MSVNNNSIIVDTKVGLPGCPQPEFDRPVTSKENMKLVLEHKKPYWVPITSPVTGYDLQVVSCPQDNDRPPYGTSGKDWFGVSWTFEPTAGGQMITPNSYILEDPSQWKEKLVFPDLDSIDFSVSAEEISRHLDPNKVTAYLMQDGLFERLLSLCPAEEALSWLLEEPEDAKAFFNAIADYKIKLIHKLMKEWVPIDAIINSDDWGTQISTFVSPKTYEELILAPMKRITDVVHSYGKYFICHSCGKVETLVPYMVKLGFHYWEAQSMNDLKAVKAQYGDKLAIQITLDPYILCKPDVTDEELRNYVHEVIETYGKNGGLLLSFNAPNDHVYELVTKEIYHFSTALYKQA